MGFTKKEWKDRLVEFAGRRQLKRISGDPEGTMVVDVTRAEGEISQAGDAFSKANMDDLENRIYNAFAEQPEWIYDEEGKITGYKTKVGADTEFPFISKLKLNAIQLAATGTEESSHIYGSSFSIPIENFKKITGEIKKEWYGRAYITLYTKEDASLAYLSLGVGDTGGRTFDIDVTEYDRINFGISPTGATAGQATITNLTLQ